MNINLKETIDKLYLTLTNTTDKDKIFENFVNKICEMLNADILILDTDGEIIYEKNNVFDTLTIENQLSGKKYIEPQILKQLESIDTPKINITLDNLYTTKFDRNSLKNLYGLFLPMYMECKKIATIIIYKKDDMFEQDIDILSTYINSVLSILIYNYKTNKTIQDEAQKQNIKTCMATLSYSELEATLNIFEQIKDNEGLVIASKIADKAGITRSVIVNALRKFEGAQIIETRSLGMKGTYIKVLNKYLLEELVKYKN